jgi:hypothetical protein
MNLFEIENEILQCFDAETGEVLDVEKLEALHIARENKLENVACWIKNLEAEATAYKEQKAAFAERQQTAERKAESLKKYLSDALNGTPFKTVKCDVRFRKSQRVEVPDVYKLDENYLRYSEPTPDKTAIKKAIQSGQEVAGAVLIDNVSMTIK